MFGRPETLGKDAPLLFKDDFTWAREEDRGISTNNTSYFLDYFDSELNDVWVSLNNVQLKPEYKDAEVKCTEMITIQDNSKIKCHLHEQDGQAFLRIHATSTENLHNLVTTIKARPVHVREGEFFNANKGFQFAQNAI